MPTCPKVENHESMQQAVYHVENKCWRKVEGEKIADVYWGIVVADMKHRWARL